jgi:hypothetical protein
MHPGQFQGRASYALTKEEKEIFFEVLFSIKVSTGFSSNIKGIVNMKDKKFQNLMSDDLFSSLQNLNKKFQNLNKEISHELLLSVSFSIPCLHMTCLVISIV